jgi:hypothetical protein
VLSELERTRPRRSWIAICAWIRTSPPASSCRWASSSASAAGARPFRHALLRAAVEKSVSDKLRADVHAAAFRFYRAATARRRSSGGRARVSRRRRRLSRRGRALYLELADARAERHRYVDAESLYSRALGQLDESELRPADGRCFAAGR